MGSSAASTSIGAKAVVAITGLALVGFVIVHLLGNLQIFLGPDALNAYAKKLSSLPALVWAVRIGLLVVFVTHLIAAVRVTLQNRSARPVRYERRRPAHRSTAARTMIWSGAVVLAFVVYHLLHFTFGITHPQHFALHDLQGRHDVHRMVVLGFSSLPVAASYVVANVLLGFHLSHGVASCFQTLGATSPRWEPAVRRAAQGLAVVVAAGNALIPIAVVLGLVRAGGS
jgi:succinate dehydrogenase / fumarate reductase cytochrome b subunit